MEGQNNHYAKQGSENQQAFIAFRGASSLAVDWQRRSQGRWQSQGPAGNLNLKQGSSGSRLLSRVGANRNRAPGQPVLSPTRAAPSRRRRCRRLGTVAAAA